SSRAGRRRPPPEVASRRFTRDDLGYQEGGDRRPPPREGVVIHRGPLIVTFRSPIATRPSARTAQTQREERTCVMFCNILVPVDGSAASNAALPLARSVARATGASISLMRVVPPGDRAFFSDVAATLERISAELAESGVH